MKKVEDDIKIEKKVDISGIFYDFNLEKKYVTNLGEKSYWSSIIFQDSINQVYKLGFGIDSSNVYNKLYIRPVIYIKKSTIGACYVNKSEYLYCDFGEEVIYDNQEYYVLEESDNSKKYVTLLKANPLTAKEINTYSTDYVSQDGEYPYYEDDTCNENDKSRCYRRNNYYTSNIKFVIDKWSNNFSDDLVSSIDEYGYKSRLLDEDDIINNLKFESFDVGSGGRDYRKSIETPFWLFNSNYWTMIASGRPGADNSLVYVVYNGLNYTYDKNYIRPVINLRKSAIESGCGIENDDSKEQEIITCDINTFNHVAYSIGDTIKYNGNKYYVIENSDSNQNYITLLKKDPLTYDELVTYNNGYEIEDYNGIGMMPYYRSDTCGNNNYAGCNSSYDTSFVKNVVDNWSTQKSQNLVEIDGYKARLITIDELVDKFGYVGHEADSGYFYRSTSDTPYWITMDSVNYWTMATYDDSLGVYNKFGEFCHSDNVYSSHAVRPVINLKKCAISN